MIYCHLVTGIEFIVKDEESSCVTAALMVCNVAVLFSFCGVRMMITQAS